MLNDWLIAVALHQFGTLVWIGGMFFAHTAVRPAANRWLEPPVRLPLMLSVFRRFFPWVWVAIILLWGSGLWMFVGHQGSGAGLHVHAMMGLAALMTLIFLVIWFLPYRGMRKAIEQENWAVAGSRVAWVRGLILVNLGLGLVTAVLGAAGPEMLAAVSAA